MRKANHDGTLVPPSTMQSKVAWFRIGSGERSIIRGIEYPDLLTIDRVKELIATFHGVNMKEVEEIPLTQAKE